MNTDFDFDNIGKRTPYSTPEGFFDEMQRKVMAQACGKQHRKRRLTMIISTALAMAAILTGFLFIPSFYQNQDTTINPNGGNVLAIEKNKTAVGDQSQADKWINELSDEELEELVSFSENDIFLN